MSLDQLISEIGGKAASLQAQINAGNSNLILPFTLLKKPTLNQIAFYASQLEVLQRQKLIIRGSVAGDEKGFVDKIKTCPNVYVESFQYGLGSTVSIKELKSLSPDKLFYHMQVNAIGLQKIAQVLEIPNFESKGRNQLNLEIQGLRGGIITQTIIKIRSGEITVDFSDEEYEQLANELAPNFDNNPLYQLISKSQNLHLETYAREWDGLEYKGLASIIVQPMNSSEFRGSIVEHPNIKGTYLINILGSNNNSRLTNILQYLVDSEGNIIKRNIEEDIVSDLEEEFFIKEIVEMKIRSRRAGFIPEKYSSQVEFGFNKFKEFEGFEVETNPTNPILFYQERRFLPFNFDPSIDPKEYKFNRFGIPDPNKSLRVINLNDLHIDKSLFTDKVPSVYILDYEALRGNFREFPNNMQAVIVSYDTHTAGGNSLEHNTYRWITKAGVAIMKDPRYYQSKLCTGSQIKLQ